MIKRKFAALMNHKWRYLAFIAGLFLFVHPFAFFVRAGYALLGSSAEATLHKTCFRMPFDWLLTGRFATLFDRPVAAVFLIGVIGTAFFFGPLFCGWLCPVGSSTETLSRQMPKKAKIDLRKKMNPAALRYGFFAAFAFVAISLAITPQTPVVGDCCTIASGAAAGTPAAAKNLGEALGLASICCRFCASSQLQNIVDGVFNPTALAYWHSGALLVIGAWLMIGGIFWQGGRGWCLYGCPLGVGANVSHWVGSKLGFTYKIKHDPTNCSECGQCASACPTWAIDCESKDISINRHTCNTCLECVKACPNGCYKYGTGK